MQKLDVEVKPIELNIGSELSDSFYRNCIFCEKLVRISPTNFHSCSNMGDNEYCPFCLRNNFHYRNNHNVLIFSFRALIGYYYHRFYRVKQHTKMWVTQIEKMIEKHETIGLNSPVLSYDPSTLLWFADFNKIGIDDHKAPFEEVENTMHNIFGVFDVKKHLWAFAEDALWDKFKKATREFYEKRKRPKGRKMLVPTLAHISHNDTEEFHEMTRLFTKSSLIVK